MALRTDQNGAIKAPTLASVIARQIEDEVVARGWPVGEVLGSENDLLETFGVSRAVLREAIRIVEHTGAARMRRGPGGGLIVSDPDRSAVVTAMSIWFSYLDISIAELLEARGPLLVGACRLAANRPPANEVEALFELIDKAEVSGGATSDNVQAIEGAIATLSRNPVLSLFIDSVADISVNRLITGRAKLAPPVTDAESTAYLFAYRRLAEALATGDADAAERRSRRITAALAGRLHDARGKRRPEIPPPRVKLAEGVANSLRIDIERTGWPVGEVLGSESELIERYDVSRAILREAVRILEHHGAVRTKRGPRGGLIVTAPPGDAVVRSAQIFLDHENVDRRQLLDPRMVLERASARLAAERRTPATESELRRVVSLTLEHPDAIAPLMELHRGIATASGNRLFALFVDLIAELTSPRLGDLSPAERVSRSADAQKAHERIVAAIAAGDAAASERLMTRSSACSEQGGH